MNISDIKLELYVVVSQDGKFFRSVGYGGGGKSWVDTIDKAKIYPKLGQARSRVTWWYNTYPKYGMPYIVKLTATGTEIINETDRVNKAKQKKLTEEANRKKREAEWALKDAEKRLKDAQNDVKRLKGK
jgi:hypothetical protein